MVTLGQRLKGALSAMIIAGECQGVQDRLIEITLDAADADEPALFPWNL
jgi:hypothetical protein